MIHIHGGSILLETMGRAGIPGERFEWAEVLCQGPTPAGVVQDEWYRLRASYLSAGDPANAPDMARRLAEQDQRLTQALAHDEIVLWFGPELFCQTIMICLLARFAERPPRGRLSLISIDRYPGVDDQRSCTLGALSGEQLTDLFARRPAVTPAQLATAQRAWAAIGARTPESLAAFVRDDAGALPFLGAALRRLLAELPDGGGLSRTERLILDALAAGPRSGFDLFTLANDPEPRRWITDRILLDHLDRLARGPAPLVELRGNGTSLGNEARRTNAAADVLAGRDAIALRGIDRWVGGTHLTTANVWRWDGERERLTRD